MINIFVISTWTSYNIFFIFSKPIKIFILFYLLILFKKQKDIILFRNNKNQKIISLKYEQIN